MYNPRKLTWATAEKIREAKRNNPIWGAKRIIEELKLDIPKGTVSAIIYGRTYKTRVHNQNNPKKVLTEQQVRGIKGELKLGKKSEWLAVKHGVSMSTIVRIKYALTWAGTK